MNWEPITDEQLEELKRAPGHIKLPFVNLIARIEADRAKIAELLEEGSALSAGQCIVDGGLIGNEYGHPVCTIRAQLHRLRLACQDMLTGISVHNERDPDSKIEGPVVTELERQTHTARMLLMMTVPK